MNRTMLNRFQLMHDTVISASLTRWTEPEIRTADSIERIGKQSIADKFELHAKGIPKSSHVDFLAVGRYALVWVDTVFGHLPGDHVSGECVHPREFPQHANDRFLGIEPFRVEHIAECRRQLSFVESHDRKCGEVSRGVHGTMLRLAIRRQRSSSPPVPGHSRNYARHVATMRQEGDRSVNQVPRCP